MKIILLSTLLFFTVITGFSQSINGQWHGYFNSRGDIGMYSGDNTEYVLDIEIKGTRVEGLSYSYFQGRRYYVICKLEGTYYPSSKSLKVIEVDRVKGNTPPDFQDCFQVHYLTYEKKDKQQEELTGKWVTKPGQPGSGCGNGSTTLVRRTINKSLSQFNKNTDQASKPNKPTPKSKATIKPKTNTAVPPIAKTTAPKKVTTVKPAQKPVQKPVAPPIAKSTAPAVKIAPESIKKDPVNMDKPEKKKVELATIKPDIIFEKRKTDVLKTIQVENETFKVDLYDNGEVDGDSISLFYNNKLILSHKKLSEKPITLTLSTPDDDAINELTMYAENLGEIPPNTALMVVTDGDKRYEVRIASDLKNSGTIRFIHKPKNPQ